MRQATRELVKAYLATVTEDGSPYGVPMSYAFDEESHVIYEAELQEQQKIKEEKTH